MSTRTILLAVALVGACVAQAGATPFVYTESASGDLPSLLPAATVFTLDLGQNTVSGTQEFFSKRSTGVLDSFAFEIPVGMELTGITYSFVLAPGSTRSNGGDLTEFTLDNDNALPTGPNFG